MRSSTLLAGALSGSLCIIAAPAAAGFSVWRYPALPSVPAAPAEALLASTAAGVALVDPSTGAVLSEAPLAGARDLEWDPWSHRAWAFVGDEEDDSGEVLAAPITQHALSPFARATWTDGDARLAALPAGVVVFERDLGERWSLLANDGRFHASLAAPPPLSLRIEGGALDVLALAADGSGLLERWQVAPAWTSSEADLQPVPVGDDADTRLVRLPDGRDERIESDGENLCVGPPHGPADVIAAGGLRVSAAIAVQDRIVVLLSGADRLVTFRVDAAGAPVDVDSVAVGGHVAPPDGWFSRSLAALGAGRGAAQRVAVATDAGVEVVRLGPSPSIDKAFAGTALRGPVVAIPAP